MILTSVLVTCLIAILGVFQQVSVDTLLSPLAHLHPSLASFTSFTSTALTSKCTIQSTRAFFANGTLPAAGTVCQVDESPFPTASKSTSSNAKNLVASVRGSRLSDYIYRGINSKALRNLP